MQLVLYHGGIRLLCFSITILEQWYNFCGNAMVMVFFWKWFDTERYHRYWCNYLDLTSVYNVIHNVFHKHWLVYIVVQGILMVFHDLLLVFMVFRAIFMIFHFLSFVSVLVSFVIVQVYLSLYYQARPRVQKVPPESHRWRCERFQTAWHVNGFGLLETWILALAWMEIPGPPAYLHQTGTLPMANVFSFWRTQAGRILTRYWRLPVVNNLSSLSFEVAWLTLLRARTFPQCRRERVPFKGTHDILQSIWYGGRCVSW